MIRPRFPLKRLSLAALLALSVQGVHANPLSPTVANGQASFASSGNILTVTNTPGTIIHWQDFSIQANEVTRFAQQSAASTVLNRVTGANPSNILGSLQSNGRVFLINPNGILFGQGATVDVAGMLASTLNLSNADFLAGRYRFGSPRPLAGEGQGVRVTNQGNITAESGGQIYLIAPNVENTGIINAPNGEILLAAGHSVELVDTGNPNLRINITAPAGDATNVGQLVASAGNLGLFGTIVKNSGTVNASSATLQGGKIVFKASQRTEIAGTVTANSTAPQPTPTLPSQGGSNTPPLTKGGGEGLGGTIHILGNEVGIMDGAKVSADGANGGGTILIGGDYQGKNPDIPNAQITYVAPTASISADGGTTSIPSPSRGGLGWGWGEGIGNGGKVIVWSDSTTRAYGNLSARGGANGGNGGFIETSGHYLDVAGITVNAQAPKGIAGSWLLDPINVTVTATADAGGTFAAGVWTPNATGSTITAATIQTALNAGTNVTINTTGALAEAGDITVNAALAKTAGAAATLTLNATNNILINQPISSTVGALNLTLNHGATGSATLANSLSLLGGNVDVQKAGVTGAGTLNVTVGTTTLTGTIAANTLGMSGGILNLNGAGPTTLTTLNFNPGSSTLSNAGTLNIGSLNVTGSLVAAATATLAGAGAVNLTGTGTINATCNSCAAILVVDGAGKVLTSSGTLTMTGSNVPWAYLYLANGAGPVVNGATGTWNLNGGQILAGAGVNFGFTNSAGGIFNAGAGTTTSGGTVGVAYTNSGTMNVNAGTLSVTGALTQSGTINVATGTTLAKTAGFTNTAPGILNGSGSIAVGAGAAALTNNGTINPGTDGTPGILSITGDLVMAAGGKLSADLMGAAAGSYDVLAVTGISTLTNGTLVLKGVGVAGAYPIITSTGGFGGTTFGATTAGTFTQTPAYTATSLTLNATTNSHPAAGSIYWTGNAADGNWATAANWSNALAPTSASNLYVGAVAGTVQVSTAAQAANNLYSDANLTLATGGALTLTAASTITGTLLMNGGTLTDYAGLTANNYTHTAGTLNIGGNTLLKSAGSMAVNGAIAGNVGGTLTLQAANNIVLGTGASITASGVGMPLNVVLNSNSTGTGGAISLASGTSISSNGGNITLGGGLTPSTVAAMGSLPAGSAWSATAEGIYLTGATLNAGGGNIVMNGLGAAGIAAGGDGIYITGSSLVTTTGAGTITLNGAGGAGGAGSSTNTGVRVGTLAQLTAVNGNISITGQGGAGATGSNYGVYVHNGAAITSTGTGAISLNGTGAAIGTGNTGVRISATGGATKISTNGGALGITGNSVAGDGMQLVAGALAQSATGTLSLGGGGSTGIAMNLTDATLSSAGNLTLNASGAGAVTQTASTTPLTNKITVGGLELLGAGATYTLGSPNNAITTLAGNTGTVTLSDTTALAVGTVNTVGLTTTGATTLVTPGNITLNAGGLINAGTANVTLASTAGNFINNSGSATPVTATNARIYSSTTTGTMRNGMTPVASLFNGTYAGGFGAQVIPTTGTVFLYTQATAPTLTIVANALSKVYGTADPTLTYTTTGLVGGDTTAGVLGGALTRAAGANVGAYTITQGTLAAAAGYGYTVTYTGASLGVTAAPLTLTGITAANKVYDGTATATISGTPTLSGVVAGDVVGILGSSTGSFADKNVGTNKTVSFTGLTLTGAAAGNYSFAGTGSSAASITAAPLTLSGMAASSKVYDGTTVAALTGGTLVGLIGTETLIFSGQAGAFANKNVGTAKTVTVSGAILANGSGLASNYNLTQPTGLTANITAAPLTVSAAGANKMYDGLTTAAVTLSDNRIVGDVLTITNTAASFADKNVATAKPVSVSGISVTGTDAANYTFSTTATTTANITAAPLTITASANNKTYDGTTAATLTLGTLTGVIGTDVVSLTNSASFADKNAATAKPVTASYTLGGLGAANYSIANPVGLSANITPATLTYAANSATRVYAAADPVFSGSVSGFVAGETLATATTGSVSFSGNALPSSDVGNYAISGAGLSANNGNYTFVQAAGNATAFSLTPSLFSTWKSSTGGDWNTAANWNGNFIPQAGAQVTIPVLAGQTITHTAGTTSIKTLDSGTLLALNGGSLALGNSLADISVIRGGANLNVAGGTLTVNGSLTADTLTLNSGSVSGTGNLTVTTNYTQSAGTLAGTLNQLNLSSTGNFNLQQAFAATGGITLSSGGAFVDASAGGTTHLNAPGVKLTAATGIGSSAAPIKLVTNALSSSTASGAVALVNTPTAAVTLSGLATGNASAISYLQNGQALNLTGPISSAGGSILIDSPTSLAMSPTAAITSSGGTIDLYVAGDIALASVNAGSGAVTVASSGGNITSALPAGQNNITASTLTASAMTGARFAFVAQNAHITSVGGTVLATNSLTGSIVSNAAVAPVAPPTVLQTLNKVVANLPATTATINTPRVAPMVTTASIAAAPAAAVTADTPAVEVKTPNTTQADTQPQTATQQGEATTKEEKKDDKDKKIASAEEPPAKPVETKAAQPLPVCQ